MALYLNVKIDMKNTFLLLSLVFILTSGVRAQNNKLPELSLKNLKGESIDLQSFAGNGKITVFSFWATWCAPCKKELKTLHEVYGEWQAKYNMELVAVSTDNARNTAKVKPFVDGQGWDFDVLLDVNENFKRAMNASNIPFTFVIDLEGNIVYTHLGYLDGDEAELEKVLEKLVQKKN